MASVVCPACGEDEDLRGERRGDAVVVTCGTCGARDATTPGARPATGDWRARRADLGLHRHLRTRD